jgi:hypothetical protein
MLLLLRPADADAPHRPELGASTRIRAGWMRRAPDFKARIEVPMVLA